MKEALKLTTYANCPPRTPVLQCDKIIRKGNQTIKVTSQLIDKKQIKKRISNIKDRRRGMEGRGLVEPIPLAMVCDPLTKVIIGKGDVIVREEKRSLLPEI